MNSNLFSILCIIFSTIIIQVNLKLSPEKKQELLNKLTKKILISDLEQNIDENEYNDYINEDSFKKMTYNFTEIKQLMARYYLPESYNYLNETEAKLILKIKVLAELVGLLLQQVLWHIDIKNME